MAIKEHDSRRLTRKLSYFSWILFFMLASLLTGLYIFFFLVR